VVESAAEKELRAALNRPLSMHSSLSDFLRKVFGDKGLMSGPEHVDWMLYDIYSSPAKAAGEELDVPASKKFINDLWMQLASAGSIRASGELQNYKVKLAAVEQLANSLDLDGTVKFIQYGSDFIYFRVSRGPIAVRLYANVLLEHGPDAMECLATYATKTKDSGGLVDMKIAGPTILKSRADTIVVYCSSKEAAQAAGAELLKHKAWLGTKCPELTTPIQTGLGLATGAEPEWQATGLRSVGNIKDSSKVAPSKMQAQSFGTIRCELIAMAIHNFNANKDAFGSGFEVFQKFVQVAFLGYGLDPSQPGD